MNRLLCVLFFCILAFPITAQETNEDAFYAISSLRFLVDQATSSEEETIAFSSSDIDSLWDRALQNHPATGDVINAKLAYDASSYKIAKKHLRKAWKQLHPDTPSCFQKSMTSRITPYLISPAHPAKPVLDQIFLHSRAIANDHSLMNAGFIILFHQPVSHIIVAKHPQMDGYLVKLYLDHETRIKDGLSGWEWFARRCEGANNVRNLIQRKHLKFFAVPDKSIYPVPKPDPSYKSQAILVVTDMQLCSPVETESAWYYNITTAHLDELFCILSHGYASAFLPANMPLTRSGKFACIDTEHPKRKIKYSLARRYINNDMKRYWDKLVASGGKKK